MPHPPNAKAKPPRHHLAKPPLRSKPAIPPRPRRLTARAPAIQPAHHSPQHNLEDPIRRQRPLAPIPSTPRHRIHDIPQPANARHLGEPIIQLLQRHSRPPLTPDLEELNPHLMRRGIESIQLLGNLDNDRLRIVAGDAVGNDNHIDGLNTRSIRVARGDHAALVGAQVRAHYVVDAHAGGRAAAGADLAEKGFDLRGVGDVAPAALGGGAARGVAGVEEVEVDAVGVVRGADGRDGAQEVLDFAPGLAGHGARVVDDEDGVKGGEEGVRVVGGRDGGGREAGGGRGRGGGAAAGGGGFDLDGRGGGVYLGVGRGRRIGGGGGRACEGLGGGGLEEGVCGGAEGVAMLALGRLGRLVALCGFAATFSRESALDRDKEAGATWACHDGCGWGCGWGGGGLCGGCSGWEGSLGKEGPLLL